MKEGRRGGEINWDARDGYWRVRHEEHVLSNLKARGVDVPEIYASFEVEGNSYLVVEFIDGENFQQLLNKQNRRLTVARALDYGLQLAQIISQVHAAGWVWRDCKPANLVVTPAGR